MRTSGTLFYVAATTTAAARDTLPPQADVQPSAWHSPVPYLFGGLAAMLGLIAFALLILACSYWKLSGQANSGEDDAEGGPAAGKGDGGEDSKASPAFEEKFLVIMAGDVKPTFLATPTSSRASSLNDVKTETKNETKTEGNGESSQESQEQIQL